MTLLDDVGDVGQQLVQVERLRDGGGHLEQEVEQFGPLLKTYRALGRRGMGTQRRDASTILTRRWCRCGWLRRRTISRKILETADAAGGFHAHLRADRGAHQRDVGAVAPPGTKPVEVLTKSAPASLASAHATAFCRRRARRLR